jgi:hypothetical protein
LNEDRLRSPRSELVGPENVIGLDLHPGVLVKTALDVVDGCSTGS